MARTIAVVSAGLRNPSTTRLLADDLAQQVTAAMSAPLVEEGAQRPSRNQGAPHVVHVEIREHAHALADALLTGFATGPLKEALDAVAQADGLVVVTPTFSASYSGLFKTFFDVLEPEVLHDKPVLLAATGGTERHSLVIEHALRPLFAYLGALPVRTGVYAATSDFGGEGVGALQTRVARAAAELATAVGRLPERSGKSADDLDEVTPFEQLLRGQG